MPRIFISYRREDSADAAGRIYDRLESHFGRESVFIDVDAIPFGVDFREHLSDSVSQCDVLLAIIGDQWANARYRSGANKGKPRLDDPADYVRIEIEAALARGVPVVPVLVGQASIPSEQNLPESLKDLIYRQAAEVRSGPDFRGHIDRLIRGLEQCFRHPISPNTNKPITAREDNDHFNNNVEVAPPNGFVVSELKAPSVESAYNAALVEALRVIQPVATKHVLTIGNIKTPAELQDLWTIDEVAYGEASITYEAFLKWWEAFPVGLKALRSGQSILGAIGIWPISNVWAKQLKRGLKREAEISPTSLRSFRRRRCKCWYVSGIVLQTQLRKTRVIKTLLNDALGSWLRESSIAYPAEILALAYSAEGEALLDRFGFFRLQNASSMPDGFPLYGAVMASQEEFVRVLRSRGLEVEL